MIDQELLSKIKDAYFVATGRRIELVPSDTHAGHKIARLDAPESLVGYDGMVGDATLQRAAAGGPEAVVAVIDAPPYVRCSPCGGGFVKVEGWREPEMWANEP